MAAGKRKAGAVRAALKAGLGTSLVTDHTLARELVQLP